MITVVVPLSAFLRFIAGLFSNSFRALTSLRDRLFLGLVTFFSQNLLNSEARLVGEKSKRVTKNRKVSQIVAAAIFRNFRRIILWTSEAPAG